MKEIKLINSDLYTIVDDDIFEKLSKYKWYLNSGYAIYGSSEKGGYSNEEDALIALRENYSDILNDITLKNNK